MTERGCVYCGVSPTTREHVVPQWANALLKADEHDWPPALETSFRTADTAGAGPVRTYSHQGVQLVVCSVCESCNTGWMSNLESSASPILEALARGENRRLSASDQLLISAWASKTALMMTGHTGLAGPFALLEEAGFTGQVAHPKQPPINSLVRLAFRAPENPAIRALCVCASVMHRSGPTGEVTESDVAVITLAVRHVVTQVVVGRSAIGTFTNPRNFPLTTWPLQNDIVWPPKAPLIRSEQELVAFNEEPLGVVLNDDFVRPSIPLEDGAGSTLRTPSEE